MFHLTQTRWAMKRHCPSVAEWVSCQSPKGRHALFQVFRLALVLLAILAGLAWYQRTINMWQLKNIGDTFISKDIGGIWLFLGETIGFRDTADHPGHLHPPEVGTKRRGTTCGEGVSRLEGRLLQVIHFLGDGRMEHPLYCFSKQPDNNYLGRSCSSPLEGALQCPTPRYNASTGGREPPTTSAPGPGTWPSARSRCTLSRSSESRRRPLSRTR